MTPLHFETTGHGAPLVMLHGFTQTGRLWGQFGRRLEADRLLVRVDLPGHGGSSTVRADLPSASNLVAEVINQTDDGATDVIGYSLGSRVALHLALSHPHLVRRLVLIGATGGIEDDEQRQARRLRDDTLATELENTGEVDGFLHRWLGSPMFNGLSESEADVDERRRNTASGLASSLRLAGTGTQLPLWDQLPTLDVPVMVLAGANDPRFVAHAVRIAHTAPNAVDSVVPGAGHAVHLQQPDITARTVKHWLAVTGLSESTGP